MSESERRRKYRYDRVLIETARVLSSTFDDAVVFLSGVQLEMLRNVTQYLRRLETYVTEYNPGYYLTPTVADYDAILAIVADLEETLMGNLNTIWGYHERWKDYDSSTASGAGDCWVLAVTVPANEVLVLQAVEIHHDAASAKELELYIESAGWEMHFGSLKSADPVVYHHWQGSLSLAEGDKLFAHLISPGDGKKMYVTCWGYTMDVP